MRRSMAFGFSAAGLSLRRMMLCMLGLWLTGLALQVQALTLELRQAQATVKLPLTHACALTPPAMGSTVHLEFPTPFTRIYAL